MPRLRKRLRPTTRLKLQQIVRLSAMGKEPEEIALVVGMTAGNVSDLQNHREYRELERAYCEKLFGPLDDSIKELTAQQVLDEIAPDAAEVLASILYSPDETERRHAANSILDRTGHGAIQRRAILQRHQLDPLSAKLIALALREASPEPLEGEVVDD